MDNEDLKQYIKSLDKLMDKHANDLKQLMQVIIEDIIDSYDLLIQQREQSIDKYIKVISLFLQDECDLSKPIQSLVEKKVNDVAKLKQEVAPLKEFKDVMLSDEFPSESDANKILEILKNIWLDQVKEMLLNQHDLQKHVGVPGIVSYHGRWCIDC